MAISTCGCTTAAEMNGSLRCANPRTTFEGAVLDTYERNGHDDSDFYAVVWDGEKVTTVEYASTRGWTYHNGASIDATADVKAAALAWYRAQWAPAAIARAYTEAQTVTLNARVRSTTKRGKNVGIEGVARWFGDVPVRYHIPLIDDQRIGVQVEGERGYRFVNRKSLEVIDPAPVDEAAIREQATRVEPANWRSALYVGFSNEMLARV